MRASVACGRWLFLIFLLWTPKTRAKLSLEGHFYLDGCAFLSNVSATLELRQLNATAEYALQLEARGSSTVRLIDDQQVCKLPSGFLYSVTFRIEDQKASLSFDQVEVPDEDGVAELKEEVTHVGICQFDPGQPVQVMSGYGFLSCRGTKDVEKVSRAVNRWKKAIEVEEKDAKYYKGVLLGTVIACVAFVIAGCALCIVLRLKATASERAPMVRPIRRASTPAASVQTRVTNDQNSSSQHPSLIASSGSR
ncbi:uncharacterized protein LOC135207848 [Macrobrachium nipponense]|uniref:uncharacterized protein LOC135207848 n=1 Tax=Macrobrachium nipponense TaxID=159736 RepID=UPI0030C8C131